MAFQYALYYISSRPLQYAFHPTSWEGKEISLICTKWDPCVLNFN